MSRKRTHSHDGKEEVDAWDVHMCKPEDACFFQGGDITTLRSDAEGRLHCIRSYTRTGPPLEFRGALLAPANPAPIEIPNSYANQWVTRTVESRYGWNQWLERLIDFVPTALWTREPVVDPARIHDHDIHVAVSGAVHAFPYDIVRLVVDYTAWGCANAVPFDGTSGALPTDWMNLFTICVQCNNLMCRSGFHEAFFCTWCGMALCRPCAVYTEHTCDRCGCALYTCRAHRDARVMCGCAVTQRLCLACFTNDAASPDNPESWYRCMACGMASCACLLEAEGRAGSHAYPYGVCLPCEDTDQHCSTSRHTSVAASHAVALAAARSRGYLVHR